MSTTLHDLLNAVEGVVDAESSREADRALPAMCDAYSAFSADQMATAVVEAVMSDLDGRRGVLDDVDGDVRREIVADLTREVRAAMGFGEGE